LKIKTDKISFSHPENERKIISNLSLTINKESAIAIMGKNGSGKTTLLKLLAGILKPKQGEIKFEGDKKLIGFSPENPKDGFFKDTVSEEVEFYPKNLEKDHVKRSESALRKIGIEKLKDRSPYELSIGEMKKVSIASIISGEPDTICLDEPIRSLHRKSEQEIGEILEDLKENTTIVFSTHNTDFAYEHADRIIVLKNGEILTKGKPKRILSDKKICKEAGLKTPALIKLSKEIGIEAPENFDEAVNILSQGV